MGFAQRNLHVRLVVLSRNFGEQAAICAGLKHARGRVIINMDSDLQDPPELIPTMLQHWRNGFDVVSTQQVQRGDSLLRAFIYEYIFYWMLQRMSSVTITHVGEFRLLSRRAVDALLLLPEKSIFLRHLVPWIGYKQIVIPFQRQQRLEGESAYTFFRLFKVAVNGLISCSNVPLVFVPLIGLIIFAAIGPLIGLLCMLTGTAHLPSHMQFLLAWLTAVYLMFAMTVISLYIAASLTESRARPLYIVSEVVSCHEDRSGENRAQSERGLAKTIAGTFRAKAAHTSLTSQIGIGRPRQGGRLSQLRAYCYGCVQLTMRQSTRNLCSQVHPSNM